MSGTYGNYGDDDFAPKGLRKKSGTKREKPLRKVMHEQLVEEREYMGFSSYDDLNRYSEELDSRLMEDEAISGEADDLNGIKGVSYAVRW